MTAIKVHFDGKVLVPDEPIELPVNEPLHAYVHPARPNPPAESSLKELAETMARFPSDPDAPTDRAAQHDHYLYGHPKR